MKFLFNVQFFFMLAAFLLLPLSVSAGEEPQELIKAVAALELGFGDYHIAVHLSKEQVEKAKKTLLKDSYPGTYSFSEDDFTLVVDKDTHLILAMYKRSEEAGIKEYRTILAAMMDRFGEPTAVAHEKIIYWAWGDTGKISEDIYRAAKEDGKLKVLATVKLNASESLAAVAADADKKVTLYSIVTSDSLLEPYMQNKK